MKEPSISLSERMGKLPSYLFGMLNTLKNERRSMGYDIIDLGMGNPNDATPEPVIESLCNAARDHRTHRYPIADGMISLKKELSSMYRERYGVYTDPAREIIDRKSVV
jgi:alanine-synthesizing transaminase